MRLDAISINLSCLVSKLRVPNLLAYRDSGKMPPKLAEKSEVEK